MSKDMGSSSHAPGRPGPPRPAVEMSSDPITSLTTTPSQKETTRRRRRETLQQRHREGPPQPPPPSSPPKPGKAATTDDNEEEDEDAHDSDINMESDEEEEDDQNSESDEEEEDEDQLKKEEITQIFQAALVPTTLKLKAQNALLKKQNRLVTERLKKLEDKENTLMNMVASLGQQVEYLVRVASKQNPPKSAPIDPPGLEAVVPAGDAKEKGKEKPTWSDIAATLPQGKPAEKEKEKKKPMTPLLTKAQRRLVIPRDSDKAVPDLLAVRTAVNTTLKSVNAGSNVLVTSVTENARHNLVFLTREDCKASEVLKHHDAIMFAIRKLDDTASTIKMQETWAKVMVHSVNLIRYPDTHTGLGLLAEEIKEHNPNIEVATAPRYMTHPDKRQGKTSSTVILAVRSEADAKTIIDKGILIDGQRKRSERYWAARPTDQCNICQGFGHHWRRCKATPICGFCAESHKTREHECKKCPEKKGRKCGHTKVKCANCNGPHQASDSECPTKKAIGTPKEGTETTPLNTV